MASKLDERTRRELLQLLGAEVRKGRERAGLTQAELGALIGSTAETIGRIERAVQEPGAIICLALRDSIGLALDSFSYPRSDRIERAYASLSPADRRFVLALAELLATAAKAAPGRTPRSRGP